MKLSDALSNGKRDVIPSGWKYIARRHGADGSKAKIATYVLCEAQYKDGPRKFGKYLIQMKRGDALVVLNSVKEASGAGKTQTAKKWLLAVAKEMGWSVQTLASTDARVTLLRDDGRSHVKGDRGVHVGTYVTISNYNKLTWIGDDEGHDKRYDNGKDKGSGSHASSSHTRSTNTVCSHSSHKNESDSGRRPWGSGEEDDDALIPELDESGDGCNNHPATEDLDIIPSL